ncbi:MAG: S8 family serine peptidase [Pseudomonadota bacterium]
MTTKHLSLVLLFLTSAAALADDGNSFGDPGPIVLGGDESPVERAVFIVQLKSPSAAEFHATLSRPAAAAAKPGEPRTNRFEKNSAAMRNYAARLEGEQRKVIAAAGPGARQIYSYKFGLNGLAIEMTKAQAQKLRDNPGVANVWRDEIRPLATSHSPSFLDLYAPDVGLRGGQELDGENVVIAVIDSGIAPEHPGLSDTREADRPSLCQSTWAESTILGRWLCRRYKKEPDVLAFEPPENWNGICEDGERFETTDCNNKLIGARWYIDGAESAGPIHAGEIRSPRDADGHGTHTATTAAGNRVTASIYGTSIGEVEGMAPRARVAVYKACWLRPGQTRASCNTTDVLNAIDDAVADGVDVINYSIGSTMQEIAAPDDLALLAATKAGVVTVVAAGNEGPNLGTIGSPAGGPWVITVGASTRTGITSSEGFDITSPPSITGRYAIRESSFSPPLSEQGPIEGDLVLADDGDETTESGAPGVINDGCQPLINGDDISGNIALLQRSQCDFVDKVRNAQDAGAIAALVYNNAGDPILMTGPSDGIDIPAFMIGQADGNLVLAELDDGNTVSVTLDKELVFSEPIDGNVMANFSARGPGPANDVLKPDLTAPGVNIVAGFSPDSAYAAKGEDFAYLSGTSMSTPHVAGVAALLRQAHPDWSPAAIKSALMTTARQDLTIPGGSRVANPFDYGAGHIVPNAANDPGLVYDVLESEYDDLRDELLAETADLSQFNHANISVGRLANQHTVTRRVTNVSDSAGSYTAIVEAPPGIRVDVVPPALSLAPQQTGSFDVTLTYESGPMDLWRFGALTWSDDDHDVRTVIAVKPTSIAAPEEVSGQGETGSLTIPVTFGYNGPYTPVVYGLNLPYLANQGEPPGFVDNDPTKTFTRRTTNGVTEHARLVTTGTLLARFALFDRYTDGNDDLDMYVYYCGPTGELCDLEPLDESGSLTSEEEVTILFPQPGVYGVYVHGFETDQSNGAGANYTLFSWGLAADQGNMTATGPSPVSSGQTADVTVNWAGLVSNSIYLGAITHNTAQGIAALTIVLISE